MSKRCSTLWRKKFVSGTRSLYCLLTCGLRRSDGVAFTVNMSRGRDMRAL